MFEVVGTEGFVAPEVLKEQVYSPAIDGLMYAHERISVDSRPHCSSLITHHSLHTAPACSMFAVGVTAYLMISGRLPFDSEEDLLEGRGARFHEVWMRCG